MTALIPETYQDLLKPETRALAFLALVLSDGNPQVTPVWFDFGTGRPAAAMRASEAPLPPARSGVAACTSASGSQSGGDNMLARLQSSLNVSHRGG